MGQELDNSGQASATRKNCHPLAVIFHDFMYDVQVILQRLNCFVLQQFMPLFLGEARAVLNLSDELPVDGQELDCFPEFLMYFVVV